MVSPSLSCWSASLFACFALAAASEAGTNLTVTSAKGQTIGIELLSFEDGSVTFRRNGNPQEFTLPIASFDGTSQELIRKESAKLPAALPKIKPEVVIGKRRKKGNSWYMVRQEITCTVKLANLDLKTRAPSVKGTMLFIGQNRRTPGIFTILSNQSFEASLEPAQAFSKELEAFSTSYDSDNKGYGNVGGFQYYGYILALADGTGNIVLNEISSAGIRQELADKPTRLKEMLDMKKGQALTEKMMPSRNTGGGIVD